MYSSNFNTGEFETGQSLWDQDPLLWNFPTYIPLTMWLLWAVVSDLPDSSPSDPAELNQVSSWSKGHYPGKRERFNQEALWMQWFCGSHRASGSQGHGSLVSTNQRPMFTEVMEEEGLWVRRESRVPLSQSLQTGDWPHGPEKKLIRRDSQSHRQQLLPFFSSLQSSGVPPDFVSMRFFWVLLMNPYFTRTGIQV